MSAGDVEREQAKARAAEHRRRQQAKAAAREAAKALEGEQAPVHQAEPAAAVVADPERSLSAQERAEAAEMASNRRTIWLPEPITDPLTGRRILAYDPATLDEIPWLREVLAEQVSA